MIHYSTLGRLPCRRHRASPSLMRMNTQGVGRDAAKILLEAVADCTRCIRGRLPLLDGHYCEFQYDRSVAVVDTQRVEGCYHCHFCYHYQYHSEPEHLPYRYCCCYYYCCCYCYCCCCRRCCCCSQEKVWVTQQWPLGVGLSDTAGAGAAGAVVAVAVVVDTSLLDTSPQ